MNREKTGVFQLPEPMSGVEAVRYVSRIGMHAFEPFASLTEPEPDEAEAKLIRAEAEKLNIALPCLSVGIRMIGEEAAAGVERLKGCARACHTMGIPYLHHTVHLTLRREEALQPFDEVLEEVMPRIREVYDYAADLGVKCVYEDQGYYFNGIERFGRFFEALERPAGVVVDIGNAAFVNEKAAAFARKFAKYVSHVHVKDYKRCPWDASKPGHCLGEEMLTPAILGEGDMGVRETLDVLNEIGYDGWLMLENESMGDPYNEQKACAAVLDEMLKAY